MKKACIVFFVLLLVSSLAFAASFSPTLLRVKAPTAVQYNFDGKDLTIPVTVSGTPATIIFSVYTKDKKAAIAKVKNGFLGWHYVNKIDTCLYTKKGVELPVGSGTVVWNGKDDDGKTVAKGDYTYHLFAFDSKSVRTKVLMWGAPGPDMLILEKGEDGKPLAKPILTTSSVKWVLGSDPDDAKLRETTSYPGISAPYALGGRVAIQPNDFKTVYLPLRNDDTGVGALWKYTWTPNGAGVRDTKFNVTYPQKMKFHTSATIDANYVYTTENNYKEPEARANLHIIEYAGTGEFVGNIDQVDFWGDLNDLKAGAQANGGPGYSFMRDGILYLGCHCSCLKMAVNPLAYFDDVKDNVLWVNDNGDYLNDHNDSPSSAKPWVCNDFNVGPYNYSFMADSNGWSFCPTFDMGAVSMGLMGPDGTGIGYFAFAGETAMQKSGILVCDNDSPYDGLYTSINDDKAQGAGTWFIGHDSVKGVISSQVGVSDAPAAFSVAQNSPNPFNPSTTVTFTLAKAGKVTIDVFNAAGQKVDTIVNANMTAGAHSAVWNASKFSAGVYFYSVKSNGFERTMKMTLLK